MSRSTRVGRLEEKSGSDFQVAIPHRLNAVGEPILSGNSHDEVATVRYHCDKRTHTVNRNEEEEYWAFEKRARGAATVAFPDALILFFGAELL